MQWDLRDVIEGKFRNSTFSIFSQPRSSACRITSRRLTATRGGGVANDWRWLWPEAVLSIFLKLLIVAFTLSWVLFYWDKFMLVDNNFLTCQIDWQLAASQAEVKLSQILNGNFLVINCDISNMAELPSFSPPASESTLQYRTSPLRQARMRPKLKAAPVYIYSISIIGL